MQYSDSWWLSRIIGKMTEMGVTSFGASSLSDAEIARCFENCVAEKALNKRAKQYRDKGLLRLEINE